MLMDRICKILIVEDDDAVRRLIGDVLDYPGYEFKLASSGAEMRQALDAEDFDVAIIDVGLRDGEDGFTLAEVADAKGCGVILTTGDPDRRRRLEKSSRPHVMKPFRMQQLTELVEQVLTDTAALCAPRPRDNPPLPARV
jgi:two-component system torCAD operon response regulator TorR